VCAVIGAERECVIATITTLTIQAGEAQMSAPERLLLLPLLLASVVCLRELDELFGTVCFPWLGEVEHLIEHHSKTPVV
jgi:hypothetical protein